MVSSKFAVLKKVLKRVLGESFSLGGSLESEVPNSPSSVRLQGQVGQGSKAFMPREWGEGWEEISSVKKNQNT